VRAPGCPVRATLERVRDTAGAQARSAADQILRSLDGTDGASWTSELIVTCRERLRRALADAAIARHLLRELDEIDAMAAGKSGKP
jgi:hypothetical protein